MKLLNKLLNLYATIGIDIDGDVIWLFGNEYYVNMWCGILQKV